MTTIIFHQNAPGYQDFPNKQQHVGYFLMLLYINRDAKPALLEGGHSKSRTLQETTHGTTPVFVGTNIQK